MDFDPDSMLGQLRALVLKLEMVGNESGRGKEFEDYGKRLREQRVLRVRKLLEEAKLSKFADAFTTTLTTSNPALLSLRQMLDPANKERGTLSLLAHRKISNLKINIYEYPCL